MREWNSLRGDGIILLFCGRAFLSFSILRSEFNAQYVFSVAQLILLLDLPFGLSAIGGFLRELLADRHSQLGAGLLQSCASMHPEQVIENERP